VEIFSSWITVGGALLLEDEVLNNLQGALLNDQVRFEGLRTLLAQ
jgi:hypothetical protein